MSIDVDLSVDVDLDKAVPCEDLTSCETPATWHSRNTCPARHGALLCNEHRLAVLEWLEVNGPRGVFCTECNASLASPYMTWRKL